MPGTARAKEPSTEKLPLKERIRRRAYELYVQRGNQSQQTHTTPPTLERGTTSRSVYLSASVRAVDLQVSRSYAFNIAL